MILIYLFRLNDATQGETIHLNSQKLPLIPPGFSQSSCSRCLRLKQEQSCFCSSKSWEYCENFPKVSSHLPAPLCMWKHPQCPLFPHYVFQLGALQLQMCVCLCATHIQVMNRNACERAPLLRTLDTSLPHTFIANQCRWRHFLTQCHWQSMGIMPCFLTVTGNQWGWRHHLLHLLIITSGDQ